MNKILRNVVFAGIAASLTGTLWFLYSKTQSADFARENRIIANLRELEALDAEWTVDSLRAKTGINRKYDAGATPAERLVKASQRVEQEIAAIGVPDAAARFTAVKAVFSQKNEVTRRFAEQNRNLA